MAKYSIGLYGTATYGPEEVVNLYLASITASPTDIDYGYFDSGTGLPIFNRVTVRWQFEDTSVNPKVKLLRSTLGFAISVNDPTSVIVVDTYTTTNGYYELEQLYSTFYVTDTSVAQGTGYYYTLFVYDTTSGRWVNAGQVYTNTPFDHDSINRVATILPPYLTTDAVAGPGLTSGLDVMGVRDASLAPSSPNLFPKFLAGIAWPLDQLITDIDQLGNLWNPARSRSETLQPLADMLGLSFGGSLGDARTRSLLLSASTITGQRGTPIGIKALVEALTGVPAQISIGKNIFLDTEQASFTSLSTSTWNFIYSDWADAIEAVAAWEVAGSANPLAGSDLEPASEVHFSQDDTTPGCLRVSRINAGGKFVHSDSGVRNVSITHRAGRATVTTSTAHGLRPGDVVSIVSSSAAFDGNHAVDKVLSNSVYTFLLSGSTNTTSVTAGFTNPPLAVSNQYPYPNPFAISQGIPVPISGSVTTAATTTNGSTAITVISATDVKKIKVGMAVSGTGIPSRTTVVSISSTTVVLSNAATATATGAGVSLTFAAKYIFSFKAYADKVGVNTNVALSVIWYDSQGRYLSSANPTGLDSFTVGTSSWVTYPSVSGTNGQLTAPEGAAYATWRFTPNGFYASGRWNLYLDKFHMAQFVGGNTTAADIVYQEPRMVTVTMAPTVGNELLYDRVAHVDRSVSALEKNLPVGTPYRVLIVPGISTATDLGSYALGAAMSPSITLAAVTEVTSTITTTANTTNTSATITVSSASNLRVGMSVTGTGIPSDTTVLSISSTTVVLSNAATATATSFSVTLTFRAIFWSVASGYALPVGISLNTTTGVISGTPSSSPTNTAGTKIVLITATDYNGTAATKLFTITLTPAGVPSAPTFASGPVFSGDVYGDTDMITEQITVTAGDIIDYEFTFMQNNIVIGTKVLTKAQAEATHRWSKVSTPPDFLIPYSNGSDTGPGYAYLGISAVDRASATTGVRVRARNAVGYSPYTFSAGTGSITDTTP